MQSTSSAPAVSAISAPAPELLGDLASAPSAAPPGLEGSRSQGLERDVGPPILASSHQVLRL